jgi:hypothetical protein
MTFGVDMQGMGATAAAAGSAIFCAVSNRALCNGGFQPATASAKPAEMPATTSVTICAVIELRPGPPD